MQVKIVEISTENKIRSEISLAKRGAKYLPSIIDGWRFNFGKHSKGKHYLTYTLCTIATPNTVEGCLIIGSEDHHEIYMAFIEVAPHNKGSNKKFNKVAGCLIAFACRQSFALDKGGFLAFDIEEENKEDELKLMALYSTKYNAVRIEDSTTMLILPEGSEKLINDYLK